MTEYPKHNRGTPRMITFEGRTRTLAEWASSMGVTKDVLSRRLTYMTMEEAFHFVARNVSLRELRELRCKVGQGGQGAA